MLAKKVNYTDGVWRDISVTGTPHLELDGTFNGGMGILRDITEKKATERELQEAYDTLEQKVVERTADLKAANELLEAENAVRRKLESHLRQKQKMEAVGTLAGGIAHDFNNLLFVISGNAELAKAESGLTGAGLAYINSIVTATKRATYLVKQILTFARKSERKRELVQVRAIIAEALELMVSALPSTIEMQSDLGNDKCVVNADPTEIHQIVMNLCNNAGQAMHEQDGKLTISLCTKDVDDTLTMRYPELDCGPYAVIRVSDTGVGIDPDLIDRIFEPFFTTKAIGKGTGMGLSVVHGIVTDLGGMITVFNNPVRGTTFEVFLPIAESGSKEAARAAPKIPGGKEHVMVVDDVPEVSQMVTRMLSRLGYRVTAFENGKEALAALHSSPASYQIILTDQTMPKMNGIELTRKVRERDLGIPVILMTGYIHELEDSQSADSGISSYLRKPVKLENLANSIRDALAGKAAGQAAEDAR